MLRLLGRTSSGEGDENFEEENTDLKKNGTVEEYQVLGNLIHPLTVDTDQRAEARDPRTLASGTS